MYLPSSEDNMRLLLFPPPCTMISSKILHGGFLESWELAPADSGTLSYPSIIPRYLGFWLQTKRTLSVSALLWPFLVRCLLSVWQTSADSRWLPYKWCGIKLNMLNILLVEECRASSADFGILFLPKNSTIAAPFQQQQLLNLDCIEVKCLPGVVHYIL